MCIRGRLKVKFPFYMFMTTTLTVLTFDYFRTFLLIRSYRPLSLAFQTATWYKLTQLESWEVRTYWHLRGGTRRHTFNWIKERDAATSQVYYLSFKYSSTCFGHPHAHHQELISCSRCLWFKYSSTCFGHPHAHHQEPISCSRCLWFTCCHKRYCIVNLQLRKGKRNCFTNILQLSLS